MGGLSHRKTRAAWLDLPLIAAILLGQGCAVSNEPSIDEALTRLLGPPVIKPEADTFPVHDTKPVESALMERRVRSMAHYSTAMILENSGKPKEALGEYYHAGMANAADTQLVLRVARKLLNNKASHNAVLLLIKATEAKDAPAELDAWLGIAYARQGKLDFAITASEAAIRKHPGSIQAYKNLCRIYSETKKDDKWKETLARAEAFGKPNVEFLIELAMLHHARGLKVGTEIKASRAKSRELLGRARALKPEDLRELQALATGYELCGGFAEAAEICEDLLKKLPNGVPLHKKAAELYLRASKPEKARSHIESILKINLAHPQANRLMGFLLADEGKHEKALLHFARVVAVNPGFQQGYWDLVDAQLRADKAGDAKKTLEAAGKRFPKRTFLQEYMTAVVHVNLKEYADAVRHYIAAETLAARHEPARLDARFYFQKGAALERDKKYGRAEDAFRKSIKLDPDYASSLNYLGYMWAERGENLKEARVMIEKANKLSPDNAAYLDSMAWVLFQMGEHKEALAWQLKALKAMEKDKETDAVLFEHLGDIYHALKNDAKAREFWEKSLAVETNPKVKARLDKLPKP